MGRLVCVNKLPEIFFNCLASNPIHNLGIVSPQEEIDLKVLCECVDQGEGLLKITPGNYKVDSAGEEK